MTVSFVISFTVTLISLIVFIISVFDMKFKKDMCDTSMKYLKTRSLISLVIIAICIPFLINEAYKVGSGYITEWDAGDMLSFYGAVLTFAGTSALSYVAIKQNERLIRLEEKNDNIKNASHVIIDYDNSKLLSGYKPLSNNNGGDFSGDRLYFSIENSGEAFLKEIEFDFGNAVFISPLVLAKNQTKHFYIEMPESFSEDSIVNVTYTSCYGVKTYADFKLNLQNVDLNVKNVFSKKYYHYYGLERKETK